MQYIGERQLYVTFSLPLSFYRIGNGKRESKKGEERESVFPTSRDRLFYTTYYSSSSPSRLDALGDALFSLKKREKTARQRERKGKEKKHKN